MMLSDKFIYETAQRIYNELPDAVTLLIPRCPSLSLLNSRLVPELAEDLTAIIADLVGQLINAGSERDAVQAGRMARVNPAGRARGG